MNKDQQLQKEFLEKQLEWCKEQDLILAEIERKLHEMKSIAEYALKYELSSVEIDQMNRQLNELKREVDWLEKQRESVVH